MSPRRQLLARGRPLNVVCDGNSLTWGAGASAGAGSAAGTTYPARLGALLAPLFPHLAVANLGHSGFTWRNMAGIDDGQQPDAIGHDAAVDQAYDPAANNVLVAWETTNAITETIGPGGANRTPAQAASDARGYVVNRLAARPGWKLVLLGSLPRQSGIAYGGDAAAQAAVDRMNGDLASADALIAAGLRGWGGRTFVSLRGSGSPFRLPDYGAASFAWNDPLWSEAAGGRVHLRDAGYAIVAGLAARAIANLAAR